MPWLFVLSDFRCARVLPLLPLDLLIMLPLPCEVLLSIAVLAWVHRSTSSKICADASAVIEDMWLMVPIGDIVFFPWHVQYDSVASMV